MPQRVGIFPVMVGRRAGGLETYEVELIRALATLDAPFEYHIFCTHQAAKTLLHLTQPHVHQHVLWPALRWLSVPVSLPLALRQQRIDLLHATFVPPPWSPTGYVLTMHDISTIVHPEFYPPALRWRTNTLMRRGLRHARQILCVSASVRDDVAAYWGIPPERLAVAYHGVDPRFQPLEPTQARAMVRQTHGIDQPYILYVGRLEQRKNIVRLLEAFHRVRHAGHAEVKLVLIGRREWVWEEIDTTMARLGLREHVLELGFFEHHTLPAFYSAAEMLVFPSLWEGFGLPVLEAMACGCPVITSNLTCLPEVAGGAALLVDPYAVDDLAQAMQRVLTDTACRAALRVRGLERARFFTWQQTAQQTLAAYARALALG